MSPRSVFADVNPDLLIWARETAGLDLSAVARRLRKVDKWELGAAKPTVRQLETLADLYKRPLAAFFLPARPEEAPFPTDFRVLLSDEPRKLSRRVRLALRRARRIQRLYRDLSGTREAELGASPALSRLRRLAATMAPEDGAGYVRESLHIDLSQQLSWANDYDALRAWRSSVEALGVLVLQLSFPVKEARGFSLSDGPIPTIVVSSSDAVPARIFSLFHELSHLLLDKGGVCLPDPASVEEPDRDTEQFCNHFAGALLVPLNALRTRQDILELPGNAEESDERLTAAARAFKVSRYVILRRLLVGHHISIQHFRRTMDRWRRTDAAEPRQRRKGAVKPAVQTLSQLGIPFVSLVLDAQARGTITSSDVSDYLSIRLKHLQAVQSLIAAQARG